jgi:myo-inositol catabolism protein IolC
MKYKIITSSSPEGLNEKVNKCINEGFIPVGSHQVSIQREVNRYSGSQHMDTLVTQEYSQTLIRETKKNVIEVDVSFYHPDDNEEMKVYDEEGMREEFEYKLDCLIKNAGL